MVQDIKHERLELAVQLGLRELRVVVQQLEDYAAVIVENIGILHHQRASAVDPRDASQSFLLADASKHIANCARTSSVLLLRMTLQRQHRHDMRYTVITGAIVHTGILTYILTGIVLCAVAAHGLAIFMHHTNHIQRWMTRHVQVFLFFSLQSISLKT